MNDTHWEAGGPLLLFGLVCFGVAWLIGRKDRRR